MTATYEPLSDLAARVDLPTLVESYSGQGRRRGDKWAFTCPHPAHADRSPSFSVYLRAGKWRGHCFVCGFDGDALDLVRWLDGSDLAEAARRLRSLTGTPEPSTNMSPRRAPAPPAAPTRPAPPTDTSAGWSPMTDTDAAQRLMERYLQSRGWPPSVVSMFGLTVVLDDSRRPRLRHPFHAWNGLEWTVCGWQDRALSGGPKWLTATGATLPPYNAPSIDRPNLSGVIVTEGPADCVTAVVALADDADRFGVIGVAGNNGWRKEWAQLLRSYPVVIAADPDEAGERLVNDIQRTYRGPSLSVVRLAHGDLTDTAQAVGMEAVRSLLLAPFTSDPEPVHDGDRYAVRSGDTTAGETTPTPEHNDTTPTPMPAATTAQRMTARLPRCSVCGGGLAAGQTERHYVCSPSLPCCGVPAALVGDIAAHQRAHDAETPADDEYRRAWIAANVAPVLGEHVIPPAPYTSVGAAA